MALLIEELGQLGLEASSVEHSGQRILDIEIHDIRDAEQLLVKLVLVDQMAYLEEYEFHLLVDEEVFGHLHPEDRIAVSHIHIRQRQEDIRSALFVQVTFGKEIGIGEGFGHDAYVALIPEVSDEFSVVLPVAAEITVLNARQFPQILE